jgi:hypothetical protein
MNKIIENATKVGNYCYFCGVICSGLQKPVILRFAGDCGRSGDPQ